MGPALLLIAQLYRVERLARSLTSEGARGNCTRGAFWRSCTII